MQKQFGKNVWEKSNDACSLSIRVQTTEKHISSCFFTTTLTSKKINNVFSERELEKALRDTLTRAEWYGSLIYHGKLTNQIARLAAIVVKIIFPQPKSKEKA